MCGAICEPCLWASAVVHEAPDPLPCWLGHVACLSVCTPRPSQPHPVTYRNVSVQPVAFRLSMRIRSYLYMTHYMHMPSTVTIPQMYTQIHSQISFLFSDSIYSEIDSFLYTHTNVDSPSVTLRPLQKGQEGRTRSSSWSPSYQTRQPRRSIGAADQQ